MNFKNLKRDLHKLFNSIQFWRILTVLIAVLMPIISIFAEKSINKPEPKTETSYYTPQLYEAENFSYIPGMNCQYSLMSNRSDAFRCFHDSNILDPCFSTFLDQDILECIETPYNKIGLFKADKIEREVLKNIENFEVVRKDASWFIVLESGEECNYISGTSYLVADYRANYACSKGLTLFDVPEQNSGLWKIRCVSEEEPNEIMSCKIKKIWY